MFCCGLYSKCWWLTFIWNGVKGNPGWRRSSRRAGGSPSYRPPWGGVSSAQAGLLHGGFMKKILSTKVLCIYHFVVKRLRARFTKEFQVLQCLECWIHYHMILEVLTQNFRVMLILKHVQRGSLAKLVKATKTNNN